MRYPTMGVLVLGVFCLAGCTDEVMIYGPDVPRPANAAVLTEPLVDHSMILYDQADFGGTSTTIADITAAAPGVLHEVGDRADSMSSLRWNLPEGVIVVFYEDADGGGRQLPVWGSGEVTTLSPSRFDDVVSRWAWYYIGDDLDAPAAIRAGRSDRPLGAAATAGVPRDSVVLYQDASFEDAQEVIGPATAEAPIAIRNLKGAKHSASSVRWNLPRGTVVVLYADESGLGQQLALWGSGQYDSLSPFDLNDDAASWAWFEVEPND